MAGVNWQLGVTDPMQGVNQGLASLGQSLQNQQILQRQAGLDKLGMDLHNMQMQSARAGVEDAQAKREALLKTTGATTLSDAYVKQTTEQRSRETFNTALDTIDKLKKAGASPETRAAVFKATLGKDPVFKDISPAVSFVDDDVIKLTKKYGPNEIPDPAKPGSFLPEGTYNTTLKRTGNPAQPLQFVGIEPYQAKDQPETWGEPIPMTIGGKKAMVQKSSRGQVRPVIQDTSTTNRITVNAPATDEVSTLARQVAEGRLDPNAISKRGGLQQKVYAEVEKIAPGFNFTGATANAKFATNAGNLTSRALIQGVEPLYNKLEETGKKLGNTNIPGVNRVVNWVKEQSGNPEIVAFNNLRDDVIAESERILLGSGVLSDNKYLRAVKNVNSAQSYPQLKAAVAQLRTTVKARLEALDKKPYPGIGQPQASNISPVKSGRFTVQEVP